MSVDPRLELLTGQEDGRLLLLAPDVGLFTEAAPPGAALAPGQRAGTLLRLGRPAALVVPGGVAGRDVSPLPDRVRAPVGYRDVLYVLAPLEAGGEAPQDPAGTATADDALVLPCPQSGRFYHRPAPDDAPFAAPGDELEAGRPVGLIEVMKTFAHVVYRPGRPRGGRGGPLPDRARLVRYVAADGSEVEEGAPLIEVEPA